MDLEEGDKEHEQPVADEGAFTLVHQEGTSIRPQQNGRRTTWMTDYVLSGNAQYEIIDSSTYLALFLGCDPVRF